MQWEIALAVVLIIGIYAAIREARKKGAAHKEETGEAGPEKSPLAGLFRKNDK